MLDEFHHLIENQALAMHWADQYLDFLDTCIRSGSLRHDDVIGKIVICILVFLTEHFSQPLSHSLSVCSTAYYQGCEVSSWIAAIDQISIPAGITSYQSYAWP